MYNDEYLASYIKFIRQTHDDVAMAIFDADLRIKYFSPKSLDLLNLRRIPVDMKLRDLDFPHLTTDEIKYISETVLSTKTRGKYIVAYIEDGQILMREHYASPIINDKNNDVVGMYVEVWPYEPCATMNTYFDLLHYKLNKVKFVSNKKIIKPKIKLTPKEHEVLFLAVLGKSQKEIAEILSKVHNKPVKTNSVASIISKQIYPKFDVYNLPNLVELAIALNIVNNFPKNLLRSTGLLVVEFEDPTANEYYRKLKEKNL